MKNLPVPRALATWFFSVTALAALGLDLATKWLAFDRLGMPGVRPGYTVLPGMLWFETNLNEGALFGLGQGLGWLFSLVSVAAIVGIVAAVRSQPLRRDRLLQGTLGLVAGGILGNLFDRLGLPGLLWHAPPERSGQAVAAVRDWIHFRLEGVIDWPIFNLADTWLVIGAAILLLISLRPPPDPDQTGPAQEPSA